MALTRDPWVQFIRELEQDDNLLASSTAFERAVRRLLSADANADGMNEVREGPAGQEFSFDFIFAEGYAELGAPTPVVVRYLPRNDISSVKRLAETIDFAFIEARRVSMDGVIVVHNLHLRGEQANLLDRLVADLPAKPRVAIWGFEKLRELSKKHTSIVRSFTETTAHAAVEYRLSRNVEDSNRIRLNHLADLRLRYNEEGLALFLGAGVSVGSGVPGWESLVGALFSAAFSERLQLAPQQAVVLSNASARLNSNSPLQMARYLKRALNEKANVFEETLSSILYRNVDSKRIGALLEAIAILCIPGRSGSRVHSVITYNFDDLLEERLRAKFVETSSIYYASAQFSAAELPVYHVHGFLPRSSGSFERLSESLLTFSEEGYHQLYSDPYHWSNIIQLNTARERTCLFLGLSLTDPNLRRLLELSARGLEAPRHFAFMRRLDALELLSSHRDQDITMEMAARFLEVHHAVQESVLAELGINVIWFDSFDEMPNELLRLADRSIS
jgi:hypothetical protein